ncbi:MAG TPA: quinoprotein dehydrogenase-associated putative ABC transporter substrate-binding protein [Rhizomicrobium sp.]|jgi:quinoprotein dehydrogenase-associated probable ABC transporter substrate-binding protein|nr:quinoprotein dehydrogenase-associated putative ABC transporter substrate-binding protein [Rhizomicrobium sp.]
MRISLAALALLAAPIAAHGATLRVCSDPNNLPFSNRAGQGFENKIAELVARDLGMTLTYTWAAQHETFVKRTLNKHACDVVMGVPEGYDEVDQTRPYYASTYVFVARRGRARVASLTDPRLHTLKIGVHLIGNDPAPPEAALGQEGIVDNVSGFMIYGDYAKPNPPARLIEAVEHRQVDVAAVWGPLGGYFAKVSPVPLTVTPITGTHGFAPLSFRFAIAMGVRKGDVALRTKLDGVIARERSTIRNILAGYGVPLVDLKGGADD